MPASGPAAPGRPAPGAPAAAFESLHWRGAEDRRRSLLGSAGTQRASMAGGAVVDGGEVDATDLANRAPLQWFTTWRWRSRSSSGTARCSLATPSSPPGAFLDPAQSVAHGVGVAVQSVSDGAHRSGVRPHPNRFEECLALLVGKIAETVQSGPDPRIEPISAQIGQPWLGVRRDDIGPVELRRGSDPSPRAAPPRRAGGLTPSRSASRASRWVRIPRYVGGNPVTG
jgi:hypothetical protein